MSAGHAGLPRDFIEFAGRRARAQGADVHAVSPDFFGQPVSKQKVEPLRSGVGTDIGDGLEGGCRSYDHDISGAALTHRRKKQMGQMNDRSHVHLHHIQETFGLHLAELAVSAETSVVDQDFNGQTLLLGKTKDLTWSFRPREVGREDLRLNLMAGGSPLPYPRPAGGPPGPPEPTWPPSPHLPRDRP